MGLLDEAIRDHLELKRRRGADPAEVAREQHEALDPIADPTRAGEPGENGDGATVGSSAGGEAELPGDAAILPAEADGPPDAEAEGLAGTAVPSGMEETAELDMKAVFEHGTTDGQDDALRVSQPIPGQEHLHFEQEADPRADS
jgi:hypothetical protein